MAALVPALAGCLVPQPLGNGREELQREPRTGAEYYLYLPEQYVKNDGINPRTRNGRWPVVVTFHGMKPYDTWDRQIHEWQEQADAYGYIVIAPWLQSCDSFAEFPLTKEHGYVLRDKEAVMAILDHVMATTKADPAAVLSTSWSSGGFMAHYFPNRFPNRFRCIATRLSNFAPDILVDSTVPMYRDMPLAIFIGDSDFPACITQSQEAVAWYKARGFKNVEAKMIDSMNHQRIPQTAAAFFARQLGLEPFKQEVATRTLAAIRMRDWEPDAKLLAAMAPRQIGSNALAMANTAGSYNPVVLPSSQPPSRPVNSPIRTAPPQRVTASAVLPQTVLPGGQSSSGRGTVPAQADNFAARTPAPGRPSVDRTASARPGTGSSIFDQNATPTAVNRAAPPAGGTALSARPGPVNMPVRTSSGSVTPGSSAPLAYRSRASTGADYNAGRNDGDDGSQGRTTFGRFDGGTIGIKLTGPSDGMSPLYIAFSADLPEDAVRGASYLWTCDGAPVSHAPRGAKMLDAPGLHTLSVSVVARDGREFRGTRVIRVRESLAGNRPARDSLLYVP